MHPQVALTLQAEREAIYRWLMDVYNMPSALARTIAEQHRVGGELVLWLQRGCGAPPIS
jgi:hypothetical protein